METETNIIWKIPATIWFEILRCLFEMSKLNAMYIREYNII
jgi:hypothetical protein